MNDRGFCPSNTTGGDFSNMYGQQQEHQPPIHNSFNNGFPLDSGGTSMPPQNGHFNPRGVPGPSMSQYRETSPMKSPIYQQHGNANFTSPPHSQISYANITAPKTSFDPYGYRQQQPQRPTSYNIQQQRTPPFVPSSRHPQNSFVEEQHSRPSSGTFGGFPQHPQSNNGASSAPFVSRPSPQQIPPFLPGGIPPPFHPPGDQRPFQPQQQHRFGVVGPIGQQQIPDFSQLSSTGNNFEMMLFDGMNGTGAGHGRPMMNGAGNGDEFPGDMGGDMPAQYVLSNELLSRIDSSAKKQALLELQIGLEQIAYEASMNFNTWATVIKDRLSGRDSLPEPDKRIAAEMIVEMSVVLDESQYNFSRLCHFLCVNIENYGENVLLPQVSAFVNETNTFLAVQHLRNLVTFLAELYDKIEVKGVKSSQLAAHLFEQLQNLLKSNQLDDQSIGIIVKVLKLVGRFLENDRGPQAMDEFFSELEEASRNASESTKDKVRNLAALRAKQWGVVAELNMGGGNSSLFPSVGILGPDGEQIPEDECNFMDETYDNFGNSPSGSLYHNPIEEDNVEDDYERFLQATAVQTAEKALEKVSIDEDDESVLSSPKFPIEKQ